MAKNPDPDLLLKRLLYVVCVLTDFALFVVVFAVTRELAEHGAESWYLGLVGAGLSATIGLGSLLGGWCAHRFDAGKTFVAGAIVLLSSISWCSQGNAETLTFLVPYWALGIGLGCLYPPLIGWLNRSEDVQGNRQGVSRSLILFCVSWNAGMMSGQLTAGSLFGWGAEWCYGTALALASVNLVFVLLSARLVGQNPVVRKSSDSSAGCEHNKLAEVFKKLSWIANLGGMFGGSLVVHLLPSLVVAINVQAEQHGSLLAAWRATIIATYLLMHRVNYWQFRFRTAVFSQLVGAVGLVMIGTARDALSLLCGLALLGQLVGYNYFSGLFYSTTGSTTHKRAWAAGIHEATLAVGMACGTLVGGALGSLVDLRLPYLAAAAFLIGLVGVQFLAWRRWTRQGRTESSLDELQPSIDSGIPAPKMDRFSGEAVASQAPGEETG